MAEKRTKSFAAHAKDAHWAKGGLRSYGYLVSLMSPRPTDERLRGLTIWIPSGEQRMEWVTE